MTTRLWSMAFAVVLSALGLLAFSALNSPAMAYSAAQADAQTEPSNDPYNFPSIQICCRPHHVHRPSDCDEFPDGPRCGCRTGHRRRHGEHGRDGDDREDGDVDRDDDGGRECRGGGGHGHGDGHGHGHGYGHEEVDVDCGADPRNRHVLTTLQEAVEYVAPGGIIRVRSAFPGSGCVGNIVITKSLTIQGVGGAPGGDGDRGDDRGRDRDRGDDPYRGPAGGNPVTAVVDGCVSIWGPGRPRVMLRDIEILGTTTGYVKDCNPVPAVNEGTTGLTPPRTRTGENLFTALMVDGGTLIGSNLSVRSAGRAFFAEHSVVELVGGNLAAHPAYDAADAAVWLLRTQANLHGVSIAGGRDGVVISMLDRYPVTFSNVAILPVRTQVGGVYPADGRLYRGKTGVRVKVDYEDLPSTADHDVAAFRWTGGTVHGYRQGIDVGPGVNGTINGVAVVDAKRAVHLSRGAQVEFDGNKITGSQDVAIQIDPGAIGRAAGNEVTCEHGACFCFGSDCEREGSDVEVGGFALHGNVCRSEGGRREHEYEDVGGNDW